MGTLFLSVLVSERRVSFDRGFSRRFSLSILSPLLFSLQTASSRGGLSPWLSLGRSHETCSSPLHESSPHVCDSGDAKKSSMSIDPSLFLDTFRGTPFLRD